MPSGSVYNRSTLRLKLPAALGAIVVTVAAVSAQRGFSESARLAAAYDTILGARFSAARGHMERACPPAPVEACQALEAATIWWEIQLDPNSRALDARLEQAAATAIERARRWTIREPNRAEAWFYLAGAHAPLVQWRVLRGHRLAAARDGKKIKEALDRAVTLDPTMHDAYFGIGLYHYYADIAPAALKALRWLLLLPGGDRERGLREILRARSRGALLRGEADYQLHLLYLWYERRPDRALDILRELDARYPSNPLFLQRIAEVQRDYKKDHAASLVAWQTLLDRATASDVERPAMSSARADRTRARARRAGASRSRHRGDRTSRQRRADHAIRRRRAGAIHARTRARASRRSREGARCAARRNRERTARRSGRDPRASAHSDRAPRQILSTSIKKFLTFQLLLCLTSEISQP